mgnify:CR=1 FL=1
MAINVQPDYVVRPSQELKEANLPPLQNEADANLPRLPSSPVIQPHSIYNSPNPENLIGKTIHSDKNNNNSNQQSIKGYLTYLYIKKFPFDNDNECQICYKYNSNKILKISKDEIVNNFKSLLNKDIDLGILRIVIKKTRKGDDALFPLVNNYNGIGVKINNNNNITNSIKQLLTTLRNNSINIDTIDTILIYQLSTEELSIEDNHVNMRNMNLPPPSRQNQHQPPLPPKPQSLSGGKRKTTTKAKKGKKQTRKCKSTTKTKNCKK